MEIVNFGHFSYYVNEGVPSFRNEEDQDWYDLRFALTRWEPRTGAFVDAIYGAWALVDSSGVITNVEYDPSRLMPGDRTVLGIDALSTEIHPGHLYQNGEIVAPPEPTPDELRANFPELSPPRFWKAARQVGITKSMVLTEIDKVTDENLREDMLIDLDECTSFIRLNSTVVIVATFFNIPPEQLDDLWLWAATQA
jgi:hypothetical protein